MPTGAKADGASPRVEALDLLRLFAALLVVLYHYTFHGFGAFDDTWLSVPAWTPVTRYFYLGVPLFFVISGFVIAYSAEGRTWRQFAVARFARIYPCFVICMTVTAVVLALFGAPNFHTWWEQWAANLLIVAPALKQPYMDMAYWSIACEVVFYALAAVAIAAGIFERRLIELSGAWLAISALNELWLNDELIRHVLITNYSAFFAAGMLLYAWRRGHRDLRVVLLLVAATGLAALQANWDADWQRQRAIELSPLVVMGVAVAAVALVAVCISVRRVPLPAAALVGIGGLTYPLYLLHQMIGYTAFNHLRGVAPTGVLLAGIILAMIAVAAVVHQFVERPARMATKRWLDHVAVDPHLIDRLAALARTSVSTGRRWS